jgi:hypothetical protein
VIDTATLYGRMVSMLISRYGEIKMEYPHWAKVLHHFLKVRDVLHNCDVHVVWVLHDDYQTSGDVVIERHPKLVGAALKEITQTCGLLAYLDKIDLSEKKDEHGAVVAPARTIRRLWVRCPGDEERATDEPRFETKNWYENVLKDPCYVPTFDKLAGLLAPKHITV